MGCPVRSPRRIDIFKKALVWAFLIGICTAAERIGIHRKIGQKASFIPITWVECQKRGRRPFRFLLNYSKTIVTNSYLNLYPKPNIANLLKKQPGIAREVLVALNSIDINDLLCEGRVYGGGLYKLEPRELCNLNTVFLKKLFK